MCRKQNVILRNVPHRTAKITFEQKCKQRYLIKNLRILERFALTYGKIQSEGKQLPVINENLLANTSNLENPLFLLSTKNIRLHPNHSMPNSYTFGASGIKIKSLDSTRKKKKIPAYTTQPEKNRILVQKPLKCGLLT